MLTVDLTLEDNGGVSTYLYRGKQKCEISGIDETELIDQIRQDLSDQDILEYLDDSEIDKYARDNLDLHGPDECEES